MSRQQLWIKLVALVVMLVAVPSVEAAGAKTGFLKKGEYLRFRGRIGSVDGGFGYLQINKVSKKRKGTYIRAMMKGRTNAFFDKVHRVNNRFWSSFFMEGDNPFRYDLQVDQAGTLQRRKMFFRPASNFGKVKVDIKTRKFRNRKPRTPRYRRNYKVPLDTHSLVHAAYKIRSLPYKKGKVYNFHVFATGRIWLAKARLVKKVSLMTLLGRRRALYVEVQAKRFKRKEKFRKIHVWLGDNDLRIPFKIQGAIPYMGFAIGELVGYRRHATAPYMKKRRGLRGFLSSF